MCDRTALLWSIYLAEIFWPTNLVLEMWPDMFIWYRRLQMSLYFLINFFVKMKLKKNLIKPYSAALLKKKKKKKKKKWCHVWIFVFGRCGQVCKSWNEIIQQDKRASFRRRHHLSEAAFLEVGDLPYWSLLLLAGQWHISLIRIQVMLRVLWLLLTASSRYFFLCCKRKKTSMTLMGWVLSIRIMSESSLSEVIQCKVKSDWLCLWIWLTVPNSWN